MRGSKLLAILLGLFIIVLLVILAKPVELGEALGRVDVVLLCPAILVYVLSWILRIVRLQAMAHSLSCGETLGPTGAFKAYISAFAINNLFPLKVGDAAMIGFLKKYGVEASKGAAIVVKGRVLDILALVLLMVLPLSLYHLEEDLSSPVINTALVTIVMVFLVVLAIVLLRTKKAQLLLGRFTRNNEHKRMFSVVHAVANAPEHFIEMSKAPGTLLLNSLLSIGIWFCEGLVFFIILSGMSAGLPLLPVIAAVMIANLGKGLPGVPGGVGVYEGIAAGFIASFGIPFQAGLAAAILDHLIKKLFNLGIGTPAALSMGYSFKRRDT